MEIQAFYILCHTVSYRVVPHNCRKSVVKISEEKTTYIILSRSFGIIYKFDSYCLILRRCMNMLVQMYRYML